MKKKLSNMKAVKHIFAIVILICLGITKSNAQEILTLEDAVKIALENNYDIRISKNELAITSNNVSIGNAGILPSVSANVVDNNSLQNTKQTRSDGSVTELQNAKNNNLTYGVGLDWTIFDGFKMFAKLDELKTLQKLGEAQLKLTIVSKISDVTSTYFDLVQQQQQLSAFDSTIVISKQRLNLAQNRFSIGKASKLETLNAQVDLNTDATTLLRQKELYENTKTLLNQILARDLQTNFVVNETISIDENLILSDLKALAEKQNPELEAQVLNKRIAELQLKQVKADRYPVVKVNSAYNFNETQSSLGFVTQSSAKGLNYGFTASLNLFDGFSQRRNEKIAKLQIENSKVLFDQKNQMLQANLTTAFQTYLTNLELTKLEKNNEAIAKQNLDITLEKFRIGTITTLEFRTAQLNYTNAKVRYTNAQFQAKLSEISLKELAGNITL